MADEAFGGAARRSSVGLPDATLQAWVISTMKSPPAVCACCPLGMPTATHVDRAGRKDLLRSRAKGNTFAVTGLSWPQLADHHRVIAAGWPLPAVPLRSSLRERISQGRIYIGGTRTSLQQLCNGDGVLAMRMIRTLGLAVAAVALTTSAALACNGSRVSADSGQITIATGPQPIPPQSPILLPEGD